MKITTLLQLLVDDYGRHDRSDLLEASQRVENLLKPHFGQTRAAAFSTRILNQYIEFRQNAGRKTPRSTVNWHYCAARFGSGT